MQTDLQVRIFAFAALCVISLAGSGAYIFVRPRPIDAAPADTARSILAEAPQPPFIVFESTAPDATYGKVSIVPLDQPRGGRYITPLDCSRVYFAARSGICLATHREGLVPTFTVDLFDSGFQIRQEFHGTRLAGAPSRTRISPDGRYAATTVFAAGDGYAALNFATRTTLVDVPNGVLLADLEQFTVFKDGAELKSPDFNFWGVTFSADQPGRFFATLATGCSTYLVEGDVVTRQASVVVDGVECPSLSPDGTRIAFKQRVGGTDRTVLWQPAVLDLATLRVTALSAETRNVDDQIEWLDDQHILYGLPDGPGGVSVTNIWSLPVDGGSPPRLFLPHAWSPAVVR